MPRVTLVTFLVLSMLCSLEARYQAQLTLGSASFTVLPWWEITYTNYLEFFHMGDVPLVYLVI